MKPRWLIDVVHATAESILNAFDEAARASGTTRSPAAARIAPIVRKQARRLLREFEG